MPKKKTNNPPDEPGPYTKPELVPTKEPAEPKSPRENPAIIPDNPIEDTPTEIPIPRRDL